MASSAQAAAPALDNRAPFRERDEQVFQSLLPLGSPRYLSLLKSALRVDLPASVLARAYRALYQSLAADATLGRLVDPENPHRYLTSLIAAARRRRKRLGAYTAEDLVSNTVGDIVATLPGPRGKLAEVAWALYLQHAMEDAFRQLVGRDGLRLGAHAASESGSVDDDSAVTQAEATAWSAWRGRLDPSRLEWLEGFIERTFAAIPDEKIRFVALDLFSQTRMAVSSANPNDPNTLSGRLGVTRFVIYGCQRAARALLYDALEQQTECEIDLSFLTFPVDGRRG